MPHRHVGKDIGEDIKQIITKKIFSLPYSVMLVIFFSFVKL